MSSNSHEKDEVHEDEVSIRDNGNQFIHHAEAIWAHRETYGPPGFRGALTNSYAALCAAFAAIGGMVFGYDQGVVSVILVMPQFLERFTQISDSAGHHGLWKGLLTAMIELGALLGAINQGVRPFSKFYFLRYCYVSS